MAEQFVFGGISGIIATTCIQPLDTIKVRLQLTGEGQRGVRGSLLGTAKQIVKAEGVIGLYAGYSAAVARQAVYGTARLGLFNTFLDMASGPEKKPVPFATKTGLGLAAGAMAAILGNPADLALVRMQADGQLPPDQRRKYKHIFDAVARIIREEGVLSLWRGAAPTVYRAMAMNAGMLATYAQAKEMLVPVVGTGPANNTFASVLSGVVAATVTLPFDMVKTRIQKQKPAADGTVQYRNSAHCAAMVIQKEGFFALWKGWVTFCVRVSPHAIITLLVNDFLHATYKSYKLNNNKK